MKFKSTLFLLLISPVLFAQEWSPYKNIEFGFIADYPGEIKELNQEVPVDGNSFEMNMFYTDNSLTSDNASNLVYAVAHTAYNIETYAEEDLERDASVLTGAVNGASQNVNGKLISTKDIMHNGFSGRRAKIEIQGAFIYVKIILVKNELYFIQVICNTDKDNNDDIDRFIDSFDIIKTK